jgi:uncharacterized iron-regulated protein
MSQLRLTVSIALLFAALTVSWSIAAEVPTGGGASAGALADAMRLRRIVLLGEVHDNAHQHAIRLQAFDALIAGGARPALLMEQFDRERQSAIERARAEAGPDRVERIITAGADPNARWNWTFYRPFVERALAHNLPIVAVNVSRADVRKVIKHGLAGTGFDAAVTPQLASAQIAAIKSSHCGLVDTKAARGMAAAQIARDQFIAQSIEPFAERGVVVLAGNGHVRRDIGAPRWLSPSTREHAISIGLLEEGDRIADAFDHVFVTPRQPREDPCLAMRKPMRPAN